MSSYESDVEHDKIDKPPKLNIGLLKYFWEGNPLRRHKKGNIPLFLRSLEVLKSFSDLELKIFSKYLHIRKFEFNEYIFKQNDLGFGFYFVYEGKIDICILKDEQSEEAYQKQNEEKNIASKKLLTLSKYDYFGELALLQEDSIRNASAISKDGTVLLGLFKPDMYDLIQDYPVIGAKFLQSISIIVAHRLFSVTKELTNLKNKLYDIERAK